jgi:hypothetical protein
MDARKNFMPFTSEEKKTVKLLHLLKEKAAPMNAFEPVMLWHLKGANKLRDHQTLQDYGAFIGRKTMIKKLVKRYNFENKLPYQEVLRLPASGTTVKITLHDVRATFQRLLTDPRINAKDYLFWGRDPLAPPPEEVETIKDLNTGQAYLQTYPVLVTEEGQALMPSILYADGTAVSHFHDMEIIQVNMALGIMTREARNKPHCWAPLGYIEKVHEQGGRGRAIVREANHMETQDNGSDNSIDSYHVLEGAVGNHSNQDFHAMMTIILQKFTEIQGADAGFLWDHQDPLDGKVYENIHYKVFVPFVKADSKEADLFCGKYAQRYSTKQICRKCHIPLQTCDDHMAKHKHKTVSEIQKLIDRGDLQGLKDISQTYLRNAFHSVQFSTGNDCGVHGSCPSELLHAFLLGIFKYLRDIFFETIGKDSEGAQMMNALAKVYSKLFGRQSDRTMPGTSFSRGIQVGKLMAKDFRGVLLIILAMVRSTKGRSILKTYRNFKKQSDLDDWILLLELMLEWESYLNEPSMSVKHVRRLEKKHRYIMYIMRKVAHRSTGMGLKLLKFHSILHIWEDIIQFGVPLEFDTSANESMHKPSKKASKMTQKAADTFNFQTATRLIEFELLDLAVFELDTGRVPWLYYERWEEPAEEGDNAEKKEPEIWTGETGIQIYEDEDGPTYRMLSRSRFASKTRWSQDILWFLYDLQEKVCEYVPNRHIKIHTCHRRDGQVFRGHPNYRGKGPWKDWVWVNWGRDGRFPCHIWCFVELENMPTGRNSIEHGGISLKDGVFAVVEVGNLEAAAQEEVQSDLMLPILKDVVVDGEGLVQKRTFYLADTEAFEDPCCVIPDIGGPTNRYFVVQPRNEWANLFVAWVADKHSLDVMDPIEEEEKSADAPVPKRRNKKKKKSKSSRNRGD